MWSGGFPLYLDRARGNRVTDVDGHEYVDFAMGDTGAMAGHSPQPTVDAVQPPDRRARRDHHDAADRGRRVGRRRAGPPVRAAAVVVHADRHGREPVGDPAGPAGDRAAEDADVRLLLPRLGRRGVRRARAGRRPRSPAPGCVGAPVPLAETTRVAEFNDLAGVEAQLAHGDVAAVLTEPALTNIGIVLPEPGLPRRGCASSPRRYGALLMIDETHTFSAGPGGATALWGLRAGHPRDRQEHRRRHPQRRLRPDRGAGRPGARPTRTPTSSTSAASAARSPATRCRWPRCARPSSTSSPTTAFERMVELATAFTAGVQDTLDRTGVPWSVSRLGRPRGVPVRLPRAPRRLDVGGGRRRRARRVPAPLHGQPRRADHAVPQHGADVPGHDGRRRRPAHAGCSAKRSTG